jgi:hypothetical protein
VKDSGICRLQRLIEKIAPTQKAGAKAGNWSIGQSWPTRYPRMWSASNPTVASYGTSVQFSPYAHRGPTGPLRNCAQEQKWSPSLPAGLRFRAYVAGQFLGIIGERAACTRVGATGNENSGRNSTRITIDHGRPGGPLNHGRPGAPNVLPRAALHTGCQHRVGADEPDPLGRLRLGPICIARSRVLGQRGLSRNRAIYFAIKRAGNQVSSMSGRGLMELL